MPFDSNLFKSILENFQIVDEFIIIFSFPVEFGETHLSRVDNIDDLAVDSSGSELLDLGEIELSVY